MAGLAHRRLAAGFRMRRTEPESSEMRMSAHFLRFVNSNTGGGFDDTAWGVCSGSAARDIVDVVVWCVDAVYGCVLGRGRGGCVLLRYVSAHT